MTSFVAKFVAKKIFAESRANKQGQEDPYFETIPATRLGIKTTKKRKRALPPGLTPQEEKVLTKVKRRAYRLDLALFSFAGIRFGWSSVIGIIPAIGDVADMLLALMVYRTICTVEPELSAGIKLRMQINIIIDFLIGLVPFVGDLADAAYKCNTRNAVLLEEELRARGRKRIKGTPLASEPDPSLASTWDIEAEEDLRAQRGPPPGYTSRKPSRKDGRDRRRNDEPDLEAGTDIEAPTRAHTRSDRRS